MEGLSLFILAEELKEQQQYLDLQQLQQQSQQQQQQHKQQQQQKNQNQQLLMQLMVQQLHQQSQVLDHDRPKNKDSETPKSEKDYIAHTSISPSLIISENDVIEGISVENSIYSLLKVIEVSFLLILGLIEN